MTELYLWGAAGVPAILENILSYAFRIVAVPIVSVVIVCFAVLTKPIYPIVKFTTSAPFSHTEQDLIR